MKYVLHKPRTQGQCHEALTQSVQDPWEALLGGGVVGVSQALGEGLEGHGPSPSSSFLLLSDKEEELCCHVLPLRNNRANQSGLTPTKVGAKNKSFLFIDWLCQVFTINTCNLGTAGVETGMLVSRAG